MPPPDKTVPPCLAFGGGETMIVMQAVDEPERKLAAILAADVVGFSRMVGSDETGTLARLGVARRDVIDPLLQAHRGRVFKVMGDGLLAEFPSVVLALRAAIAVQAGLREHSQEQRPGTPRIALRIGVHQGDVVVQGSDLLGEGVNIASRLERLAAPGGVCISARVLEDAAGKLALAVEDGGEQVLKNISRPMRVFHVRLDQDEDDGDRTIAFAPAPSEHKLVLLGADASQACGGAVAGTQAVSNPTALPGREIQIARTPQIVGRMAPSEIILLGDGVSRAHCRVELVRGAVVVTDLNSTNGTFVDDHRISAPTPLRPGALVRIGPHVLRYVSQRSPAAVDVNATLVLAGRTPDLQKAG